MIREKHELTKRIEALGIIERKLFDECWWCLEDVILRYLAEKNREFVAVFRALDPALSRRWADMCLINRYLFEQFYRRYSGEDWEYTRTENEYQEEEYIKEKLKGKIIKMLDEEWEG